MTGMWLHAGQVVGHLYWCSGGTAGVTMTHSYMVLMDVNGVVLAATADNTSLAIPASTMFTWALATPGATYTILADGYYYVGLCVSASTMPTCEGFNGNLSALNTLTPIASGDGGVQVTVPTVGATLTPALPNSAIIWMAAVT